MPCTTRAVPSIHDPRWMAGVALSALLFAVLPSAAAASEELVINGSFSLGASHFITGYQLGTCNNAGSYAVLNSAATCHGNWSGIDHTDGTGLFMAVNGSQVPNKIVWQQDMPVLQQSQYQISMWLKNLHTQAPAKIAVKANGVALRSFQLGDTLGWHFFTTVWASDTFATLRLTLEDSVFNFTGNDFGLDDISVFGPHPCPTRTLTLDPTGTFLRTHEDNGGDQCAKINLAAEGILPGDNLVILTRGAYLQGCAEPAGNRDMIGVFSASDELAAKGQPHRVPGAIPYGNPYLTPKTLVGQFDTDIPEDFLMPTPYNSLEVPAGATHLFISMVDDHFGDNCDPEADLRIEYRDPLPNCPKVLGAPEGPRDQSLQGMWLSLGRNPTTRQAKIRVRVGVRGNAELSIFDVAGRRLATLHSGTLEPGEHEFAWDGAHAGGHSSGSGLCFVSLKQEGHRPTTRPLIFLR